MKKQLLLSIIAVSLIFASCKKKKKDEETQPDPFKLEYSKLSIEEHKHEVEQAGVDFIKKINDLPDQRFISVLSYLSELNPDISEAGLLDRIITLSVDSKEKDLNSLFKSAATISGVTTTKRLSDYYGIYTWNRGKHNWDETTSSNRLEIRFPSDSSKIVNNSILSITYIPSTVKRDLGNNEKAELPAYINAVLKVDNAEEFRLTSGYTYKADGTPVKSDVTLALGIFIIKNTFKNDEAEASEEWSISKADESLMSFSLAAKGKLVADTALATEDIVKNANASFEIMNLKLLGETDVYGLLTDTAYKAIADTTARIKKEAELRNVYARFAIINKTDNSIVAKNEFFVPDSSKTIKSRMVFKDDSKMSFDEFYEKGFEAFITELKAFRVRF